MSLIHMSLKTLTEIASCQGTCILLERKSARTYSIDYSYAKYNEKPKKGKSHHGSTDFCAGFREPVVHYDDDCNITSIMRHVSKVALNKRFY